MPEGVISLCQKFMELKHYVTNKTLFGYSQKNCFIDVSLVSPRRFRVELSIMHHLSIISSMVREFIKLPKFSSSTPPIHKNYSSTILELTEDDMGCSLVPLFAQGPPDGTSIGTSDSSYKSNPLVLNRHK